MTETTFALSEVGPSLEAIHRARLWRKIVWLVEEDAPCVRHKHDKDIAVLETVTQAFAASRVCTVAEE